MIDLLRKDVDADWLNQDGESALPVATKLNYREVALVLLRKDADVNLVDREGNTALHLAVCRNYRETALTLLQFNADANAVDGENRTPLEIAVSLNSKKQRWFCSRMALTQTEVSKMDTRFCLKP